MSNYKKYFSLILVIIWMIVIFLFSAMPSNESNKKSQNTIEETLKITDKIGFIDGLSNDNIKDIVSFLNLPLRKCAHACVYLILSILVFSSLYKYNIKNKLYLFTILICFVYACTDEFHQLFVIGRTCSIIDVFIDTCGAITGCIFIYLLSKNKSRRVRVRRIYEK